MPSFQFLGTLTVDAPSEAAAQTMADHAIEDADQYLSDSFKLERQTEAITVYEGLGKLNEWPALPTKDVPKPRYTVALTTEGWQVKRPDGSYAASAYGERGQAQQEADYFNESAGGNTND